MSKVFFEISYQSPSLLPVTVRNTSSILPLIISKSTISVCLFVISRACLLSLIIDSGKIVANDSPHNLKKDYSSNSLVWYTEENSENDNLLKADNLEFERVGDAYKIKIKDSRQALEITNKHTEIVDFEIIKGNMDDVFLTVTGKRLGD